jgi:hypothetical protein
MYIIFFIYIEKELWYEIIRCVNRTMPPMNDIEIADIFDHRRSSISEELFLIFN